MPGNDEGGGQFRRLEEDDIACLEKELNAGVFDQDDARHVMGRLLFYRAGFKQCYGLREGDRLLNLQWLILPDEAKLLMQHYGQRYLPLRQSEALIENAFTHTRARGRGYYPAFSEELMRMAAARGARSAVIQVQ